jgi:hypothetical protein
VLDRWYARIVTNPVLKLSQQTYWFDKKVIDRLLHLIVYLQVTLA